MDIIKRLQLNRNPKDIKSGSIVGAKNIMLDPISSSITNEYGFKVAFDLDNIEGHSELVGYKIVGCIPCNEEIVIFINKNNNSKILRLTDNGELTVTDSNWKWEGGTVEGTFSYNYKRQLILAVTERDANHDVPLKVFNLDEDTTENYDNLEIPIPKFKSNYTISTKGELVCGVYTFFIRIKINNNNDFTKWIQITNDIFIVSIKSKEPPIHNYLYDSGNFSNYNKGFAYANNFANFFINENGISNKNINLNIEFDGNNQFEFELGYIVKRNNEVLGRIKGTYKNNINNINFYNNNFEKECSINDFLEQPHQFYDVENLINYNNRLYLSNYKDYKNETLENLEGLINKFIVNYDLINPQPLTRNISFNLYRQQAIGTYKTFDEYNNNGSLSLSYNSSHNYYYIANKTEFIETYLIPLLVNGLKDVNNPDNDLVIDHEEKTNYTGDYAICLYDDKNPFPELYDQDDRNLRLCIYNTNSNDPDLSLDNYTIKVIESSIVFESSAGKKFPLSGSANSRVGIIYKKTKRSNQEITYFVYLDDTNSSTPEDKTVINYNFENIVYLNSSVTYDILDNFDYLNNRTLIPGQIYNFYVHFVRKDFSYTNGYKIHYSNIQIPNLHKFNAFIDSFQVPLGIFDKLIKPVFVIKDDYNFGDYIGYFFTYEDIEPSVNNFVVLNRENKEITNTGFIYEIDDKIIGDKINGSMNITDRLIYNEEYREKHIKLKTNNDLLNQERIVITNFTNFNYYNKKVKTLYRLTELLYVNDIEFESGSLYSNVLNSDNYVFGFYNTEKVIDFPQELLIDSGSDSVYYKNGNKFNSNLYAIKGLFIKNYSHIPLDAFSVKEDYDKVVKTLIYRQESSNPITLNVTNKVLSPYKLKDFLELKEAYKSKPIVSYTNYSDTYIDEFNKTIYRSDIISDENLSNGFRHFNVENYKNILENKGKITNLIGVGLYLIVHTEYSLFVFDRNNQLNDNVQLQIPDTFDIDYRELTPSGEGFAGLKNKDESILTKHGYIWFDRIGKSIFIFDGKEIKAISADIHNLLKTSFETNTNVYIRFAEDYITNRLIVILYYNVLDGIDFITLSYSFDTNNFISSHDYYYNKNYKTYNNSYLFNTNINNKLYLYNKESLSYDDLFSRRSKLHLEEDSQNNLNSYVDIIFTDKYEMAKTLNSIEYILSKNNQYKFNSNIIDQYFNLDYDTFVHQRKIAMYSGFKLYITTDLMFSGELDIAQDINEDTQEPIINPMSNTLNKDKPRWNNGVWNFNNFRENINKAVTSQELDLQNVNNQMREIYNKQCGIYNNGYVKSDMRGLIIGKYFIFRFIFERKLEQGDLNIKFETLDINISKV